MLLTGVQDVPVELHQQLLPLGPLLLRLLPRLPQLHLQEADNPH